MRADIVKNIKTDYDHFFERLGIDRQTGKLPNSDKKFATYPYIGSKYGKLQIRLLIVGLDIGSDETPGHIQSFEERQRQIEKKDPAKHNPHIAGTYITALRFTYQKLPEWADYWRRLDGQATCQQLLKREDELPLENPLSYIALSNYHKFVTLDREHRTGAKDRVPIDKKMEEQLLDDEIKALDPEIVVFQSKQFETLCPKLLSRIASGRQLFIGPHPSGRQRDCRNAHALIGQIVPWRTDKEKMAEPEKMKLESTDMTEEKRKRLKALFPEVFNENRVDFDQLKRVLGEWVEPSDERFGLSWAGKAECMKVIQQPSIATLKPVRSESVNFDYSKNLFIEGDNLEVLKLLQKPYFGKVKMIYIDPPYNTGNEFIYPDKYSETLETYLEYTGQKDSDGRKFSTNTDTQGRYHSRWLNMMYPRLYLAKNLLRDDGVIFISIDDNEVAHLRALCDQVFGEEGFVACLHIEMSTTQGMKIASALKGKIVKNTEYALLYAKNFDELKFSNKLYSGKNWDGHYSIYFDESTGEKCSLLGHLKQQKTRPDDIQVTNNNISKFYKENKGFKEYLHSIADKIFRDHSCDVELDLTPEQQKCLDDGNIVEYRTSSRSYLLKKLDGSQTIKQLIPLSSVVGKTDDFKKTTGIRKIRGDWWKDYYKDMSNINKEGGIIFKNGKKPIRLLRDMLKISTNQTDTVLDFFAGSATTAHAVMELNKEDGGNRQYIMVQLPEPCGKKSDAYKAGHKTIAGIGKERIRRAAKKIGEEQKSELNFDGNIESDLGFKVFKLASSNFKVWEGDAEKIKNLEQQLLDHVDHINSAATPEDILYELLLKSGYPLTAQVKTLRLAGKDVFSIAEGALLICLDKDLTQEVVDAIADENPRQVICLDEGFKGNDQLKANAVHTFKTLAQQKESEIVFKTV